MIGIKSKTQPITFNGLRDFLGGVLVVADEFMTFDYTLLCFKVQRVIITFGVRIEIRYTELDRAF